MSSYVSAIGIIIVVAISTWPIVFLVIPLGYLFYWYQVSRLLLKWLLQGWQSNDSLNLSSGHCL